MNRILSMKLAGVIVVTGLTGVLAPTASAQAPTNQASTANPGYYTDPSTGIVYRKITRTVERPVAETKVEKQTQTVYRPETVTETKPTTRTVFTPVLEHHWEPRVHGRWNPFQQPTVAYHQVPQTRWEARAQTVNEVNRTTKWVAENRTIEVPRQIVRMQREQKVDYEPVGRVAPPAVASPEPAIASRLRPLAANERVAPIGSNSAFPSTGLYGNSAPQLAASTIGRLTSDPPRRSLGQGGLRAKELVPTFGRTNNQALPQAAGTGIAMPRIPMFR